MYPFIYVFGRPIPTYGLMMLVGFACAFLLLSLLADRFKIDRLDACLAGLFAMVGGLVGAKLLDLIINFPLLIRILKESPADALYLISQGGMVFWGGFIGGLIMLLVYIRKYKIPLLPMLNLYTIPVLVGHGFGRIGCFMVGCCYGRPLISGGLMFRHSPIAPNGVPLLPTQLIEAGFNFSLALFLFFFSHKESRRPWIVHIYLFAYPLFRFVLEFFRGDLYRGRYGPFWTSQWISIFIFVLNLLVFLKRRRRPATGRVN